MVEVVQSLDAIAKVGMFIGVELFAILLVLIARK